MTKKKLELVCSKLGPCIHSGSDCYESGRVEREGKCFDDGAGETEIPTVNVCLAESCHAYEPKEASHCRVYVKGTDAAACDKFVGDAIFVASDEAEKPEEGETIAAIDETEEVITETTDGVPDWWPDNWSKPFSKVLPVKLTEGELADYSKDQARVFSEWQCIRLAKKAYDKKANERIEEHEEALDEIAVIVSSGTKPMPVQCYTTYDADHGYKRTYRTDTFDIIEESAMTSEEMQKSFDFQAGKSVENAKALRQEQPTGEADASESGEQCAGDMAALLDEEGAQGEDFDGIERRG